MTFISLFDAFANYASLCLAFILIVNMPIWCSCMVFVMGMLMLPVVNIPCDFRIEDYHTRLSSGSHFNGLEKQVHLLQCRILIEFLPLYEMKKGVRPYYNILMVIRPAVYEERAAAELNITSTTVWRTLTADGRYPYYFQQVQHLLPQDFQQRRLFSDWYLNQVDRNPQFSRQILWTDEAIFTRRGNQRNNYLSLHENPHAIHEQHFQHEFQCNVWLGIIDDILIGLHFLPPQCGHISAISK